jgi:hypothetical protein
MTSRPAQAASPSDPVRDRRARIATWTSLAKRVGYLRSSPRSSRSSSRLATDFSSAMAAVVVTALVVGCVVLAPAIIMGYAGEGGRA